MGGVHPVVGEIENTPHARDEERGVARVQAGVVPLVEVLKIGRKLAPLTEMVATDGGFEQVGLDIVVVLDLVAGQQRQPVAPRVAQGDGVGAAEGALAFRGLQPQVELVAEAVDITVGVLEGGADAGVRAVAQADGVLVGRGRGQFHPHRHLRRGAGLQVVIQVHRAEITDVEQGLAQPREVLRGERRAFPDRQDLAQQVVVDGIPGKGDRAKDVARAGVQAQVDRGRVVLAPDLHPAGGVGGFEVAAVDGPDNQRLLGRLVARVIEHLAGAQRQPLHRSAQHRVLLAGAADLDPDILDDHRSAGIDFQVDEPAVAVPPFRQGDVGIVVAEGFERPGRLPPGAAVQAVEQGRGKGTGLRGAGKGEMTADIAPVGFGEVAADVDAHRGRRRRCPRPAAAQQGKPEEEDGDERGTRCGRGGGTVRAHNKAPGKARETGAKRSGGGSGRKIGRLAGGAARPPGRRSLVQGECNLLGCVFKALFARMHPEANRPPPQGATGAGQEGKTGGYCLEKARPPAGARSMRIRSPSANRLSRISRASGSSM